MEKAKFRLRCSEHTEVQSFHPDSAPTPILGLNWDKHADTIGLYLENLKFEEPEILTKRCILSCAHKLYDSIRISCPAALLPKLLLQQFGKIK